MNRAYFKLSDRAAELAKLTILVGCNANYSKAACKASDSQLETMAQAIEQAIQTINGVINAQHQAHTKSPTV